MTNQEIITRWMAQDASNAADAILELAATLSAGQKTALRDRIVADVKAMNSRVRAAAPDDAADGLTL